MIQINPTCGTEGNVGLNLAHQRASIDHAVYAPPAPFKAFPSLHEFLNCGNL